MGKVVGYIRVSTKEQKLDRQREEMIKLGIPEKYIYEDKESGQDFDRVGYLYMKKALEPGDTIVIKELDRIGRNQQELKNEWEYFRNNDINVRVLNMPALNIDYNDESLKPILKMVNNIIFEIMSWKAEDERKTIRARQAEGIAIAKKNNVKFGRPKVEVTDVFMSEYKKWKNGEQTAADTMRHSNIKKTTFYKLVKEIEKNT